MNNIKKTYIVLTLFILLGSPVFVFAEPDAIVPAKAGSDITFINGGSRIGGYTLLTELPGFNKSIDGNVADGGAGEYTLAEYIKVIVRIAIGTIGVLAVVMIVVAGVQYMGSGMVTEKEAAKQRLTGAVFGLILAVSSVLLLRTINPQLTNLSIGDGTFSDCTATTKKNDKGQEIDKDGKVITDPDKQNTVTIYVNKDGKEDVKCNVVTANNIYIPKELDLEGDAGTSASYTGLVSLPNGAYCPKPSTSQKNQIEKVATSFKGKNTYRYGGGHSKNEPPFPSEKSSWMCDGKQCRTFCPEGTSCLDCSAFVNQVLECAGFKRFEGTTAAMVSNSKSEKITAMTTTTANGKVLSPGDLLFYNGHVVIYIGNGKTAESFGGNTGRRPGNSIALQDADTYFKKGKKMYVYRQ